MELIWIHRLPQTHISYHIISFHFILRKAVRQADSLLCATEGRIGGLGGRASFLPLKSRSPLGERVYRESRFQGYVPCCNLVTVGIDSPLVHRTGS